MVIFWMRTHLFFVSTTSLGGGIESGDCSCWQLFQAEVVVSGSCPRQRRSQGGG